jgi:hypothetical protein
LSCNDDDIDDINEEMLKQFLGEEREYMSADSLRNNGNDSRDLMYFVEYVNALGWDLQN